MQLTLRNMIQTRWWRGVVLVLLAAFVLQTVSLAAHIHAPGTAGAAGISDGEKAADGKPAPLKSEQRDCPMCQVSTASSTFFAPAAPALRVPEIFELPQPRDETVVAVERFATHWRSRAPPTV